jgi:hypothetical protein
METTAAEELPENAATESAATKVRADSNSHGVSGYRALNHDGRNYEASYFRDSCCFHVTTLATNEVIRSVISTLILIISKPNHFPPITMMPSGG